MLKFLSSPASISKALIMVFPVIAPLVCAMAEDLPDSLATKPGARMLWDFESDKDGWNTIQSISNLTASNGCLRGDAVGGDPYVHDSDMELGISGSAGVAVRIWLSQAGPLQLFWGNEDGTYAASRKVETTIPANQWTTVWFDLSSHTEWAGKTIDKLRVDPGASGTSFAIEYIAILDDHATLDLSYVADVVDYESGLEGWVKNAQVNNFLAKDGRLIGRSTGGDPYVAGPTITQTGLGGVMLQMKSSQASEVKLYWATTEGGFSESRSMTHRIEGGNFMQLLKFDLRNHPQWAGKTIKKLRIDPSKGAAGIDFEIDNIILLDPAAFEDADGDELTTIEESIYRTNPAQEDTIPYRITEEKWSVGSFKAVAGTFYSTNEFVRNQAYHEIPRAHGYGTIADANLFDHVYEPNYFATRHRAYLTAPTTGYYRFWIASVSGVELQLSLDDSKYTKRLIAQLNPELGSGTGVARTLSNYWDNYASQMSEDIYLEAGSKYFLEVIQTTGHAYGAHLGIAWARPGADREVLTTQYLESYQKTTDDLDDDFLPDAWESQYGLDPTDNGLFDLSRQGEYGDFDGDGLSNRDEFQAGTDPSLADTDGDGVNDSNELRTYGTNPLVSDAPSEVIAYPIDLTTYSSSSNNWAEVNGNLVSDTFRGKISWDFTMTEAGVYILHAATTLIGDLRSHEELEIVVNIDGNYIGRFDMIYGGDHKALLRAVTPYLTVGSHNVELFIDNYVARRTVRIDLLDIRKPSGVDTDSDGLPDWVADALTGIDFVLPHGAGSVTSPACIEGSARLAQSVLVGSNSVQAGGDLNHWYYDLPLNTDGSATGYTVTYDSGLTDTGVVSWLETNVLDGGEIDVRVGDELLLTAHDGSSSGSYTLTVVKEADFTGDLTGYLPTSASTASDVLDTTVPSLAYLGAVDGILTGAWNTSNLPVSSYHIETNGAITTLQLQAFPGVNTKAVKIQLEEVAGGVKAHQIYARYKSGDCLGQNFDSNGASNAPVGAAGYGITSLEFEFSDTETLTGLASEPASCAFPFSCTATITGTNAALTDTMTVNVRRANLPDDTSVAQNMLFDLTLFDADTDRALDFSGGAGLRVGEVENINANSYGLELLPELGGGYGLVARLWQDGPIADIGDISAIGVSDALQNELQTITQSIAFPGYHVLSTPLVATNVPVGGYVEITIFRAGVTFLDGTTTKTFTAEDLASGLVMLEFLIPDDSAGGFCHYLDVYGANGEFIGRR